jgi:hypothetical protein
MKGYASARVLCALLLSGMALTGSADEDKLSNKEMAIRSMERYQEGVFDNPKVGILFPGRNRPELMQVARPLNEQLYARHSVKLALLLKLNNATPEKADAGARESELLNEFYDKFFEAYRVADSSLFQLVRPRDLEKALKKKNLSYARALEKTSAGGGGILGTTHILFIDVDQILDGSTVESGQLFDTETGKVIAVYSQKHDDSSF